MELIPVLMLILIPAIGIIAVAYMGLTLTKLYKQIQQFPQDIARLESRISQLEKEK